MAEPFVSDTPVSQPMNSDQFNLDYNFNGFGWDVNKGMFIPVDDEIDYFQSPFAKTEITVIPDE